MSKYIESRKQKIKELSEQLNIVNQRIDSYSLYLKKLLGSSQIYTLNQSKLNDIKEDTSIAYKSFNISFYVNSKYNCFFFSKSQFFFNSEDISFNILSKLTSFIELMDQKFDLITISNDIIESAAIYSQIKTLYFEIHKKSSDFTHNSNIILQKLNTFNSEFVIPEEYSGNQLIFLKLKKNNRLENISFSQTNKETKLIFTIILPTLEHVFNIYNSQSNNNSFVQIIFERLFKEEICKINSLLFNTFNIKYEDFYIEITLNHPQVEHRNLKYFSSNFEASINFNYFSKTKIEFLSQKFQLNKELTNF